MDDLLKYRVEDLSEMLVKSADTREAFKSIVEVFEEATKLIKKADKGMIKSLFRKYITVFIPFSAEPTYRGCFHRNLSESTRRTEREAQGGEAGP